MAKKKAVKRASKMTARKTSKKKTKKSAGKKTAVKKSAKKAARSKPTPLKPKNIRTISEVSTFEASLSSNVCDRVLACIRSITSDDNITYTTDLCAKYHWNAKSWKHLADKIAACFQAAGHPLPKPISKPAIVNCCTVTQVCAVVEATYR